MNNLERFGVDAVVSGDGSKGVCGVVLEKGVMYGSANMFGGHESFYELSSFSIDRANNSDLVFSTRFLVSSENSKPNSCVIPNVYATRAHKAGKSRAAIIRECIVKFARQNPGTVVILGGPGDREQNFLLIPYIVFNTPGVLAKSSEFDCARASMINAMNAWGGIELASMVRRKLEDNPVQFTKLGKIANEIHQMRIKCEVRRPPKCHRRSLYEGRYDRAFQWLAEFVDGVWVVRLVQDNIVDHCVAIDGNKKYILDSEEEFPLRMTADSLRFCGGPKATRLRIAEMFQLTKAKYFELDLAYNNKLVIFSFSELIIDCSDVTLKA